MRTSLLLSIVMIYTAAHAQDRSQARSMVITDRGIVATSQTLAGEERLAGRAQASVGMPADPTMQT